VINIDNERFIYDLNRAFLESVNKNEKSNIFGK